MFDRRLFIALGVHMSAISINTAVSMEFARAAKIDASQTPVASSIGMPVACCTARLVVRLLPASSTSVGRPQRKRESSNPGDEHEDRD